MPPSIAINEPVVLRERAGSRKLKSDPEVMQKITFALVICASISPW